MQWSSFCSFTLEHCNSMMQMEMKAGYIRLHQNEVTELRKHSSLKISFLYYLPHRVAYSYEQNSENMPINTIYEKSPTSFNSLIDSLNKPRIQLIFSTVKK